MQLIKKQKFRIGVKLCFYTNIVLLQYHVIVAVLTKVLDRDQHAVNAKDHFYILGMACA